MAYLTVDDCDEDGAMLSGATQQELIRLFADKATPTETEPDEVDEKIFGGCANAASEEIDGYLRRRYAVPLSPVPDKVQQLAVELTLYYGYKRRKAISQQIQDGYDRAVRWLRDCSSGSVDLGLEPPPSTNVDREISTFGDTRVMTDARLKGIL